MASDRVMVTRVKINRIADAIREKTGTIKSYELDEMPEAIRSIEGGGGGASGTFINFIPFIENIIVEGDFSYDD